MTQKWHRRRKTRTIITLGQSRRPYTVDAHEQATLTTNKRKLGRDFKINRKHKTVSPTVLTEEFYFFHTCITEKWWRVLARESWFPCWRIRRLLRCALREHELSHAQWFPLMSPLLRSLREQLMVGLAADVSSSRRTSSRFPRLQLLHTSSHSYHGLMKLLMLSLSSESSVKLNLNCFCADFREKKNSQQCKRQGFWLKSFVIVSLAYLFVFYRLKNTNPVSLPRISISQTHCCVHRHISDTHTQAEFKAWHNWNVVGLSIFKRKVY